MGRYNNDGRGVDERGREGGKGQRVDIMCGENRSDGYSGIHGFEEIGFLMIPRTIFLQLM